MTKPKPSRGFAIDGRTGRAATIAHGAVKLRERAKPPGNPNLNNLKFGRLRIAEIGRVADLRCPGGVLPEIDLDDDGFLFCASHALFLIRRSEVDFDTRLHSWIERRMPWARDRAQQLVDKFRSRFNFRSQHLRARTVAKILNIKECERRELRLTTIAVAGLTADEYAAWLIDERKRRRRERDANKPGKQTREAWQAANAISRGKPWLAEGVSRATWFRHKKLRETGVVTHGETGAVTHSDRRETGAVAPIESLLAATAPVSNAARAPVSRRAKIGRKPVSDNQLSLFDSPSEEAAS